MEESWFSVCLSSPYHTLSTPPIIAINLADLAAGRGMQWDARGCTWMHQA